MVDSSGMETLLWAGAMYDRTNREEGRRSVIGENYSACGKISSRLKLGQRIEPVAVGNGIAPLSTPQLSQSRNCSFSPLIRTGAHPIPRARMIALCVSSSPANQSAQPGIPGIPWIWAREAQMNRFSELASRVLPEPADMLREANSSDNAIR